MATVKVNPLITWVDAVTGIEETRPMNEQELKNYLEIVESTPPMIEPVP